MKRIKDILESVTAERIQKLILLLLLFLLPLCNYGQDSDDDSDKDQSTNETKKVDSGPLPIELENYEVQKEAKFLDQLLQFFKFSENSNNKEKERVNQFLQQQIEDGNMRIGPDSLRLIQQQLDSILIKIISIEQILNEGEEMEEDLEEEEVAKEEKEPESKKTDSLQEKPSPVPIELVDFEREKKEKFVDKIVQFLKFGENKKNREKERINKFLQEQIKDGNLKIGPEAVIEIQDQLNDILERISMIEEILQTGKKEGDAENGEEEDEIEEMTTKAMIDYLIQQYDSIIQRTDEKNAVEDLLLKIQSDSIYDSLQQVRYKVNSLEFMNMPWIHRQNDSTILRFKRGLITKSQVIGWHNAWMEDESENYKYNFLSGLNYYGYRLKSDGTTIKPADLSDESLPEVLKKARAADLDIYLTIYAKGSREISRFLESITAQDNLIQEIEQVFRQKTVNGVNLYFENAPFRDKVLYRQFVENLKNSLKTIKDGGNYRKDFKIMITIPGIVNEGSVQKIDFYDFDALNSLVDYYMVETDRLVNKNSGIPQSLSPLQVSKDLESGTIESTLSYYRNKNLPQEKLIMTVPFSGVEWQVTESGDLVRGERGREIEYKNILKRIDSLRRVEIDMLDAYDSVQATSSIYYKFYEEEDGENRLKYRELWFDGARGLHQKLNFALKTGIAGVSIRELNSYAGHDNYGYRYQRLWKVLASSMVEIDTVYYEPIDINREEDVDKWEVFWEDFYWTVPAKLAYWDDESRTNKRHCKFNEELVGKDTIQKNKWQVTQPYISKKDPYDKEKYRILTKDGWVSLVDIDPSKYDREFVDLNVLSGEIQCTCLNARWEFYTRIGLLVVSIIVLLLIAIGLRLHIMRRRKSRNKLAMDLLRAAWLILAIAGLFLGLLTGYLNPKWSLIGAGSDGSNFWSLLIPTILGICMGIGGYMFYKRRMREHHIVPGELRQDSPMADEASKKAYYSDLKGFISKRED